MKILLPIDFSRSSQDAVRFVASRETLLGSNPQIEILNVHAPLKRKSSFLFGEGALDDYYQEHAEKLFSRARRTLESAGFKVSETMLVGVPDQTIAAEAERYKADLIVMGTRGLGALKGLFKTSVSTGVISLAHCPVLIVRGKHDEFPDSLRVGVAVDGSAYGEAAVRYTLKHRKLFGDHASFTIINAVNDYRGAAMTNVTGIALPTLSDKDIDQLEKNEFEDTVSKVRPIFAAEGITPDEVKLVGTPADEIAAYARANGIGILVMGSHGYNRLKTAVMGSTAAALAAHGIVPLLIVKSPKIEKAAVKTAEPAKA